MRGFKGKFKGLLCESRECVILRSIPASSPLGTFSIGNYLVLRHPFKVSEAGADSFHPDAKGYL